MPDTPERPMGWSGGMTMGETMEMTLDEILAKLPPEHTARRQLARLREEPSRALRRVADAFRGPNALVIHDASLGYQEGFEAGVGAVLHILDDHAARSASPAPEETPNA